MKMLSIAMLLIAACGPKEKSLTAGSRSGEGQYRTGTPGEGWARVAPGGADRAWFHRDTGASIYFDSNCKARFEDKPLSDLMKHLTFGMAQGSPLKEEELTLGGRSALLRVYAGEVDGVIVQLGAVVIKKNTCIYDALFISSPTGFDAGMPSFRSVLDGFRT